MRIGFVLANLTTTFDEAREQVSNHISKIIKVAITYFKKDAEVGQAATGNKRDEMGANIEDTLVKLIRLIANICTDEQYMQTVLSSCGKDLIRDYMTHMIAAVERKKIAKSEEFILNAVSCSTNLLFYDTSSNESELFNNALRLRIFNATKMYILETSNEELQIEAVRVLSNLSRHVALCEHFVSDKSFVEALIVILDHTLRELVFYTIGIIINITMHEGPRQKIVTLQPSMLAKLIDVLKDANIEDMDLSKVSAKALHNLAVKNSQGESLMVWSNEHLNKLDEILSSLGEELDSIMVSITHAI